jgi:Arc/MetJ-type ribon-helix-helix transcriptional regulator
MGFGMRLPWFCCGHTNRGFAVVESIDRNVGYSTMYRILHLPPDTHDFVQSRIESGRYENPGELVQAAFRALHREEKVSGKQNAAPSIAEQDVFRGLWERSGLLPIDRRKAPRFD